MPISPRPIVAHLAGGLTVAIFLSSCASTPEPPPAADPSAASQSSTATAQPTPVPSSPGTPAQPSPSESARPFESTAALRTIEQLAALGPREATSAAYRQGTDLTATALERLGYSVTRQEFDVPAGTSWGIPVPAGITHNVIADPPGFEPTQPHVLIGAHLDTVPQSPGAEDNASGVAVLLELARMSAEQPPAVPVRFVVFGAEEPRGQGDARHHYGSQHYVAQLHDHEKQAIRAMVSLDRVGVRAPAVPLAHGGRGTDRIARALAEAAPADVPTRLDANTTSDHWSFEKAGIPAGRVGSVPFEGYHSPGDVPAVIDQTQLGRAGTVVWAWLRTVQG
ncbi:M28 family metallopeptidase [Granulicoccus sp. GXG6511]|uniref:M28 family metallopeptidase n=1 Tax=Granulicoccus sp. GXG6511 TaxID=3381351 RepID=UPI003D7F07E5